MLDESEIDSYITKTLTFPTLGLLLRHKQSKFWKNNFIFVILTHDCVHVFIFRFHQVSRKLRFPPGNDVSDKPLTPLDAHHSGDHFDINYMSVR